jgi:hypothetical protein
MGRHNRFVSAQYSRRMSAKTSADPYEKTSHELTPIQNDPMLHHGTGDIANKKERLFSFYGMSRGG